MNTLQVQPCSQTHATTRPTPFLLAPLELDSVVSIYLEKTNEAVQVSLRVPESE
jgi:hypothetical protein